MIDAACQDVEESGLACSRCTQDGGHLPGLEAPADPVEDDFGLVLLEAGRPEALALLLHLHLVGNILEGNADRVALLQVGLGVIQDTALVRLQVDLGFVGDGFEGARVAHA